MENSVIEQGYDDELSKKASLQERHYKLLRDLQEMCSELPLIFQQKLSYELLTDLANSLLDKTVFDIVKGLRDIQVMTEKNLLEKRMKLINSHKTQKEQVLKRHKESLTNELLVHPQNATILRAKQEKEMEDLAKFQEDEVNRLDMKIVMELDQIVSIQQVTMQKVGVPGFIVSNQP
ncbi:Protein DGCR6, partial [Stegodyphus mimosarum]